MIELKTFEQLVFYEHLTELQRQEAKEEAINDIKCLENIESSGLSDKDKIFLISIFDYKLIKYIKWKFNITEGDLK